MKSFAAKAILFVATSALQLESNEGFSMEEAREILMKYNVDGDVESLSKGEAALAFFDGFAQSEGFDGCDFEYFFNKGDTDGDGKINLGEFVALMNSMPNQGGHSGP